MAVRNSVRVLAEAVEKWPVDDLIPYARNAKKHPPEQVAQLAASMREFGFTIPILVAEDGTIVAGHGRVLAAKELGLAEVPVIIARGWTDEQRRAYTLADNKLAESGEWDDELLKIELGELRDEGFAVDLIGFDADEIEKLLGDAEGAGRQKVGNLADRFGVAPFSVLRAAEGWWQERKRAWLALGIQSEVGRGENLLKFSDTINEPDPKKRAARKGSQTEDLRGGLTHRTTTDPYRARAKA
jgi:ParB-like chromosome segregation protein Spo0J